MTTDRSAPCKHSGIPAEAIVTRVTALIRQLNSEVDFLSSKGISADEYAGALPSAIERIRGGAAADNSMRRRFLLAIFAGMQARGLIEKVAIPAYGDDTIYRLSLPNYGDIAIIQKGCPDGAHSSTAWEAPSWAKESYLWWLCSSLAHQPGTHVSKGVTRLKSKFFDELTDKQPWIDGVIFHNELCGGTFRPCPKIGRALQIGAHLVPPPCVYMLPTRDATTNSGWNWEGMRRGVFPGALLDLFGIDAAEREFFTGQVGFLNRDGSTQVKITSRFGLGRTTTSRR